MRNIETVCHAIAARNLPQICHRDHYRVVDPNGYGINSDGNPIMVAW